MRSFFCVLWNKGLCSQSQTAIYSSTVCIVPTASEKRFQNPSTSVRKRQSSCCMSCARAVQAPIWHVFGDAGDRRRRRRGGGESRRGTSRFTNARLGSFSSFISQDSRIGGAIARRPRREREREFHQQLLQKQQQALLVAYFFVLSREMEWKVFWFRSSCNGCSQRTGKKLK